MAAVTANSNVSNLLKIYGEHFRLAPPERQKAYAGYVIAGLERSKNKLWFSAVLKIITEIDEGTFFKEGWEARLTKIRNTIAEQSNRTEYPLLALRTETLSALERVANKALNIPSTTTTIETISQKDKEIYDPVEKALNSDFFHFIVLNQRTASHEVGLFFGTSVYKSLGPDTKIKHIVDRVKGLADWLTRLSLVTLTQQEQIDYLARAKAASSAPSGRGEATSADIPELAPARAVINGSKEMRALEDQSEMEELIGGLKEMFLVDEKKG